MPSPAPAPTPVNWGYVDAGHEGLGSSSWEYRVWVYWSNKEVTSKIVNIPRQGVGHHPQPDPGGHDLPASGRRPTDRSRAPS